ncbi:MAG TPA: protease pro-enzyme activation domain-containing protein [Candidatus Aquilonibacter sp.]|jgi:subtilase family serine protease|nr:protease pro-enzyme activation domain-containing protein [Candidatus Aquilonibacter sp.]
MRSWKFLLPLLASSLCFAAQPDRITGAIDSNARVALAHSLHAEAQPQYDQGTVAPSYKLGYMTLVMAPSATQQKALNLLLTQQQDRTSPNYHKWMSPAQYADNFGLTQNDIQKLTAWLKSEGFVVQSVGGGRNTVVFSGTAGQVQSAFGTEIHNYRVNGKNHVANATPVMIPSVLNGVVASVMGLHNFFPHPTSRIGGTGHVRNPRVNYYDANFQANFLAPGDIATNYDLTPLYSASIDGTGEKLAIIGQTDVYLSDINNFRSGFNLSQITGCTTNTSGVITACNSTNFQYVAVGTDPGTTYPCGDLGEADLDIEWSGAIAQNAQIIFVNSPVIYDVPSCNYISGGGVNAALIQAINPPSGPPLAPVISMSYGICELDGDESGLDPVLAQGNAEGVTVMNSSDDVGSAGCDYSPPNANVPYDAAVGGLAVSYPASSVYVTGVGGTEVTIANDESPSYWGTSNGSTGGSLLPGVYLPEIPWNDDEELAELCQGEPTNEFCSQGGSPAVAGWVALGSSATAAQVQEDIWISAGGGGASNCFTNNGTVCSAGDPQPTWQQGLVVSGAPAGVRYVPDVSLMASPNFPGYIFCTQVSELEGSGTGSTCGSGGTAGITTAINTYESIIGGTSASSPIFAGIVTLLNQYLAGPSSPGLGNINPTLYMLAATSSNHAFHPVTTGNNYVSCQSGQPTVQPLALRCPTTGTLQIGYSATNSDSATGYNLVNGLGSVDGNNLALAWAATRGSTTTAISTSTANAYAGTSVTFTATVTPAPIAAGNVSFYNNGSATALGIASLVNGTATFSTTALPAGTDNVTATYNGNTSSGNSTSPLPATVNVTVPFTISAAPSALSVPAGQSASSVITVTPSPGFTGTVSFSSGSCTNLPPGATCSFNQGGSVALNGSTASTITMTISTVPYMALASGTQVTVSGTSEGATATTPVSLTITATNQSFKITTTNSTFSVNAGATAQVTITVNPTNNFSPTVAPITYTCLQSSLPSEASCSFSPTNGDAVTQSTVTLSITTTPPTSQLRPPFGHGNRLFYALLLPGLFGIVFAGGSRMRGARLLSLIVILGFSMLWLGACGGSSNSSQKNPGTPAGSYSVVVNATTTGPNALTATMTVNLTVQ